MQAQHIRPGYPPPPTHIPPTAVHSLTSASHPSATAAQRLPRKRFLPVHNAPRLCRSLRSSSAVRFGIQSAFLPYSSKGSSRFHMYFLLRPHQNSTARTAPPAGHPQLLQSEFPRRSRIPPSRQTSRSTAGPPEACFSESENNPEFPDPTAVCGYQTASSGMRWYNPSQTPVPWSGSTSARCPPCRTKDLRPPPSGAHPPHAPESSRFSLRKNKRPESVPSVPGSLCQNHPF